MTIVLVPGVLGFGRLPALPGAPARDFNGIADYLGEQHRVFEPALDPAGSVATRGDRLAAFLERLELPPGEKLHLIAHSIGGLDARHAIALAGDRVSSLVAIGTPHGGSAVADAVADRTGPLAGRLPGWFEAAFRDTALHELTTEAASAAMAATRDVPGVRYLDVAGDASRGSVTLALFHVAATVAGITGQVNDGVVLRESALVEGHEHLADWPVDHAGELGWGYEFPAPIVRPFALRWPQVRSHFARYDALVDRLGN